jgi:actin-related protein
VYSISFELPDCPYNKINAQRDIEKDSMSIIIHGGFTGFGNMDERLSKEFQKKYNVKFVFLGCVRYWNTDSEDTDGYNELIFAHLERKYGSIVDSEYKHLWHDK